METITCFVVDDEKEACLRLQDIIKKFRELNFIGYERDADTAILSIIQKKPDLVFLDVEMPGKNGFEVLEAVRSNLYLLRHTASMRSMLSGKGLLIIC